MKLPFQQALVELSRQALVGTAKTVERGVPGSLDCQAPAAAPGDPDARVSDYQRIRKSQFRPCDPAPYGWFARPKRMYSLTNA